MNPKSLHLSLYEEILALDDHSSFSPSEPLELEQSLITHSNIHPHIFSHPSNQFTIKELEDDILRMQVQLQKNKNKPKSYLPKQPRINTQSSGEKVVSSAMTRRNSCETSLYEKSVRELSERKYRMEKKQKEKENRQLSLCTYQPQINANSQAIMERLDREAVKHRNESRKEEQMRKNKKGQEQVLKECIFQPNINKKAVNRQEKKNVFDELYEESKVREQKLKIRENQQIKKSRKGPTIDKISKNIMENSTFEQRLIRYQRQRVDRSERRKMEEEKENNSLYKPKINPIVHPRNSENLPIGDYLYLQRKKTTDKKSKEESKIFTNRKSEMVYEQKKFLTFYRIFVLLDDDQDGLISINSINLQSFPRSIIKILYPLLEELQVMEVELTENEFIQSIDRLFKTLSVHEKNTLLSFNSCSKPEPKMSFKPQINERSKRMAEEMQRSKMNIYDYCSIKEQQKLKQLESQRVQKNRRQLKECTFQPKIIDNFSF